MPSVTDIIQRILLQGDKAVVASFNAIGSAGAAAFDQIGQAANKLSSPFRNFQRDLERVEASAKKFGESLRNLASAGVSATTRMATLGAGVAGAGALIAAGALKVTTALRAINASVQEQRLAAAQNAAQTKENITTDFSHANALEDLRRQYSKNIAEAMDMREAVSDLDDKFKEGKITIKQHGEQYAELKKQQEKAIAKAFEARVKEENELRFQQQRQLEQTRLLRIEQEEIRKQQAEDQAAAQRRAVQMRLEAQFGAQLATTLERLATILEQVRNKFLQAFGPQISALLLGIGQSLNDNANKFITIFKGMSDQIAKAFSDNKVTIDGVLTGLVNFGTEAAKVITNVVIPAFVLLVQSLQKIAELINSVFGTNFSAATLIAAGIILKITGLFKVMGAVIGVVRAAVVLLWASFGPLGIAIAAIVLVLTTVLLPLLASIDWAAVAKAAIAAWNSIGDVINAVLGSIRDTWNAVVKFFGDKISQIIGFFNDLIKKVKEFLGLTGGSAAGSQLSKDAGLGDIGGFAGGGLFRGRAGRDTNLAWLTDKEFVVNPKAVRHWGVGFLNAINNMRNLPGFAAGGLVGPTPVPAFAAGGVNRKAPGRPMVLQIGDQEFTGLTVQDDTAEAMGRYAARRSIRQAGRRPLWFGGSK